MAILLKDRKLILKKTKDSCPMDLKLLCLIPIIYRIIQCTDWIDLTLTTVIVTVVVIIISIANFNRIFTNAKTNKFFMLFFIFYMFCMLSTMFSVDVAMSIQQLLILLVGVLLFLNLSYNMQWIHYFLKACFVVSIVSVITTFLSYFAYDIFGSIFFPFMSQSAIDFSQRYVALFNEHSGIWGQTGSNAFFIIMGMPYLLMKIKSKDNLFVNILIWGLIFVALLFTGKRGYLLWGVVSGVMAFSMYGYNKKNPIKTILSFGGCILIAFIIVVILYNYSPLVMQFIDNFFASDSGDYSSGRFGLYIEAIEIFKENPILGIGIGTYRLVAPSQNSVHNDFLQLFAETGVFGGILFVVMMLYALIRTITNYSLEYIKSNKRYFAISFYAFFLVLSMITSIIFYEYGTLLYLFVILSSICFNSKRMANIEMS